MYVNNYKQKIKQRNLTVHKLPRRRLKLFFFLICFASSIIEPFTASAVQLFYKKKRVCLTVNSEHRRFANSSSGEVLRDAGVVSLMPQFGLPEKQMPVGGLHEAVRGGHIVRTRVGRGGSGAGDRCGFLERRAVPQPINLGLWYARRRRASQFRVATGFHRQRVRRRQEVLLEIYIGRGTHRRFLIFVR